MFRKSLSKLYIGLKYSINMDKAIIALEDKDMNFGTLYSSGIKKWFPNLRQDRIDEYTNFVNGYVAISKKLYNAKLKDNFFINNLAVYSSSNFFTNAENNGYKSLYYFNLLTDNSSMERNIDIIANRLKNSFVKTLEYESSNLEQRIDSFYTSLLSYSKSQLEKNNNDPSIVITYKDRKITFPKLDVSVDYSQANNSFKKYENEVIAGNTEAKRLLFQAMDFLLCYDINKKKNDLLEVIDFPKTISLIGKPGVGKTMLITKALNYINTKAQELNKDFNLIKIDADTKSEYRSLSERYLKKNFELAKRGNSIYLILIEEFDTKIFSRSNIDKNHLGEQSFTGTFLECLEGTDSYLGNYYVLTSFNRMIDCDGALKRRLMEKVIFMNGLEKPEDHVLIFKNKLRKGLNAGYVKIKDWSAIGKKSLSFNYQGGDIKNICKNLIDNVGEKIVFQNNSSYDNIDEHLKNIREVKDVTLIKALENYNIKKDEFIKDYLEE